MSQKKKKHLGKCGILAIIVMLITGTIFAVLGVLLSHLFIKYYQNYYLILIFPIFIGVLLGVGLSFGARLGRCSRFSFITFLLVCCFSLISYTSLLFLNTYYDTLVEKPDFVLDEYTLFAEDTQNFLAELPYVADYIDPVAHQTDRDHIGNQFVSFLEGLPVLAFSTEPVVIGTIFHMEIFAPVKDSMEIPGMTRWEGESGPLVFDEYVVQHWMLWLAECFLLWLIVLVKTRKGTKLAYEGLRKRLAKRGQLPLSQPVEPSSRKKKTRRKKTEPIASSSSLDLAPPPQTSPELVDTEEVFGTEAASPKKKKRSLFSRKKRPQAPPQEEAIPLSQEALPEETPPKKRGWFRRKKKEETIEEPSGGSAAETLQGAELTFDFPEGSEEQRYALILHQYASERREDLVRLIQQVGQVSEERSRRLLRVPSLLKRDVTTQEAAIAIEKFNQVQAQVKLITMAQLAELQKKQQPAPPRPSPPSPPAPAAAEPLSDSERYALILRKIDPAYRKSVLELLASLSNTPIAQLQQTLKTPALVLRNASKDEVTMIAQQFQTIHAEVKTLTMTELQKLMTRK